MQNTSLQLSCNHHPLFLLGEIEASTDVVATLQEHGLSPNTLLRRHATGDWGDLEECERARNRRAIDSGVGIFSNYQITPLTQIWIFTDAARTSTTLMLPEDRP